MAERTLSDWHALLDKYSDQYGVPGWLSRAVFDRETGHIKSLEGKEKAVSPAGAVGPMQLMKDAADEMGVDRTKGESNIQGAVAYLAKQYNRFNQDPAATVVAYNAGPERAKEYVKTGKAPQESLDYVAFVNTRAPKDGEVADTPTTNKLPETRAQYEAIAAGVRAELAKPEAEQDTDFLRRATVVLRRAQEEVQPFPEDTAARVNPQQPAPVVPQGQPSPQPPSPPQNPGDRAFDIMGTQLQAFAQEAKARGLQIADFLTSPFRSNMENSNLRDARAQERAAGQLDVERQAIAQGRNPEAGIGTIDLQRYLSSGPIEVGGVQLPQTEGSFAPDVLIGAGPGAIVGRGAGAAAARIGTEAAVGGLLAGSAASDENPTGEAAIGALGSGVLGTVGEIFPGIRNLILRDARAARASEAYKRATEISDATGIPLTLGEKTQDPAVVAWERSVQGRSSGARAEFLINRERAIQRNFDDTLQMIDPARTSPEDLTDRTIAAYKTAIRGKQDEATTTFRKTIEAPMNKIGARFDKENYITGGGRVVSPDHMIEEVKRQREFVLNDTAVPDREAKAAALGSLIAELQTVRAAGGMQLGDVQRYSQRLSAAVNSKFTGNVIKDIKNNPFDIIDNKPLERAIDNDLLNASLTAGKSGAELDKAEAVNALRTARANYNLDQEQIRSYQNKTMDKLLEGLSAPAPEEFGKRLLGLPTSQFRETLKIADANDPGLAQKLRGLVFSELINKHRYPDARIARLGADTPRIDAVGLTKEIGDLPWPKYQALLGDGVSTEVATRMRAGLQGLRYIAEGPTGAAINAAGNSAREKFGQFAINATSHDMRFVARLLAGELAPGLVEKLLFTKAGQESLMTFAKGRVGNAEASQAVAFLVHGLEDEDARKQALQQRQAQEAQTRAQALGRVAPL